MTSNSSKTFQYLPQNNSGISSNLLALTGQQGTNSNLMQFNQDSSSVLVRITARDVDGLMPTLAGMGFEMKAKFSQQYLVEGYLPIDAIPQMESLTSQGMMGVLPVYRPFTRVGSVTSQDDIVSETNRVRAALPSGFDGTGVRVGALSDSFNVSGFGSAQLDIASGDLPPEGVSVIREGVREGLIDEGRAMLQLIHDLAPGASLSFQRLV
ncbi:MAG: hypothetical protein HC908_19005 [Calothrix sp. SM1_7_51]|nr:hypothetical protein [Calothrix sp. SM1_7_51]